MKKSKIQKKEMRHKRVRAIVSGTKETPRLSVSRSLTGMYLQLIDDTASKTMTSVSSKKDFKKSTENKEGDERKGKITVAYSLGVVLAEKAKALGITKIVFDRGGNKYHGRVKAVAEGARDGGLEF